MDKKTKTVEVNFNYSGHTVMIYFNVDDIEKFRKTIGYLMFKERFGDLLTEPISLNPDLFNHADANIYVSLGEYKFDLKNYERVLRSVLFIIDIPSAYMEIFNKKIMKSIKGIGKKYMFQTLSILTEDNHQYVKLQNLAISFKEGNEFEIMIKLD